MTADGLKGILEEFIKNKADMGICVYALMKGDDPGPFKLNVEACAEEELRDLFLQSLKDEVCSKEELSLLALSSADERINAIYVYDLDIPEELMALEKVTSQDDLPVLNLNAKSLSSIKALLIEIGNESEQLVLYKIMAPVNIFGRSSFFLRKHESRLEKLDDEFLRISPGFQMMQVGGKILVLKLEVLEQSFGFHDVIKREARLGVDSIVSSGILVNPEVLNEIIDDVKYARRLTKVSRASPVLMANISGDVIVRFCKNFPGLTNRIRFNKEENKIILDTKVSRDLFIKVLMDDFLTSELTKFHYASVAKDALESGNQEM